MLMHINSVSLYMKIMFETVLVSNRSFSSFNFSVAKANFTEGHRF